MRLTTSPHDCTRRFFSFYYCRDPPSLHSFPTRRSSDLDVVAVPLELPKLEEPVLVDVLALDVMDRIAASTSTSTGSSRSEEHTSELQSPDHLVCRLLLEKKKDTVRSYETAGGHQSHQGT